MENRIELKVNGMMCEHCVATVKKGIEALGCKDVCVDLKAGTAFAAAPDGVSAEKLIAAIKSLGFDAQTK